LPVWIAWPVIRTGVAAWTAVAVTAVAVAVTVVGVAIAAGRHCSVGTAEAIEYGAPAICPACFVADAIELE